MLRNFVAAQTFAFILALGMEEFWHYPFWTIYFAALVVWSVGFWVAGP